MDRTCAAGRCAAPIFGAGRQIGQVFGVTLDDGGDPRAGAPNIYATATSMFGLNIVAPHKAGPGAQAGSPDAKWIAGQFGPRGGPEERHPRIDRTGQVNLFANVAYPGRAEQRPRPRQHRVRSGQQASVRLRSRDRHDPPLRAQPGRGRHLRSRHARPAAGDCRRWRFDPARRVGIDNPAFNVEDPSTWGCTAPARRVFGLAIYGGRRCSTRWRKGRRSGRSASIPTAASPTTRAARSASRRRAATRSPTSPSAATARCI